MENRFILFEGLDGTGKSTLAKMLSKKLNCPYVVTPPKPIRFIHKFIDTFPPTIRYWYYFVGNALASIYIKIYLKKGNVICDRYTFTTAVTHSVILNKEIKLPLMLLHPDIIIYTQASEETIEEKLKRKRYESRDILKEMGEKYLEFLKDENVIYIDTDKRTPDECLEKIISKLLPS